jgi:hypothetical protein
MRPRVESERLESQVAGNLARIEFVESIGRSTS